MISRYLVSYDIADPERLRKVHAIVKAAAHRVQDSVYEALLTERERVLLAERLVSVIHEREDQVLFLDLGSAAREQVAEISTLGLVYRPQRRTSVVF